MVDQKDGISRLTVKVHMDDMKRVEIREQDFYHNILHPFTLGIAFPSKYGQFRVTGGTEMARNMMDAAKVFSSDQWRLHPDWVYCEYNFAESDEREFDDTPENSLLHFLDRISQEGVEFDWGNSTAAGNNSHFCDKELVQSFVLDGEITQIFDSQESRQDLFKEFGIELSFVATRSGLTRWEEHKEKNEFETEEDYDYDPDNPREPHFADRNSEATDKVWYKRAVEYHYNNPSSFVFSVPFDIGDTRPTLVTATHAIFKEENGEKAPAAVVGVHIDFEKFEENFMKATTGAGGHGYRTSSGEFLSCKNESIECYVIDNNGFVIISENPLNTGKFFGEIDGTILKSLEKNQVFKKIKIFDYQAICLEDADDGSPAQPKSCDKETFLYQLNETALHVQRPVEGILQNCHESSCERPFSVALIPNTNLVLVVADKTCPCYSARISLVPTKVAYGPKNESP